jgi:hypothetical protein
MESPKTYRIIVSITLAVAVLIGCEHYVFPVSSRDEILDNGTSDVHYGKRAHTAWYFITKEGSKIRVPEQAYNRILIGEKIRIDRSLIFRVPISLGWYQPSQVYTVPIGVMNDNHLGDAIMVILILFGVLVLTGVYKINKPYHATFIYLYAVGTAATLLFYLTY